jgi:purine-cytosine permease-like protein
VDGTQNASIEGDSFEEHEKDDFARTRLPQSQRKSSLSVFMVLFGICGAFFFPAVGGAYVHAYGAQATIIGLIIGFVAVIALSLVLCSAASREGLTAELLTRGCGYGYMGTVLTALIYATCFAIYGAIEGQILATSIGQLWHLPELVWYIFVGLLFIPLTWRGMKELTWVMYVTLPVYVILVGAAVFIALKDGSLPAAHMFSAVPQGSTIGVLGLVGVLAGLAGTIALDPLEAADYNRFVPTAKFWRSAWLTVVLPWGVMFLFAMPLGVFFTLKTGETNPAVYFSGLLGPALGVVLAWVSQIRINLTNVHLGSIAYSSASERMGIGFLGRRAWVVIVSFMSIAFMYFDILGHVLPFLEWTGLFLMAWVGTIIADLLIVRRLLGIVTGPVEYHTGVLRPFNPVGPTALVISIVIGSVLRYTADNPYVTGMAAFITFGIAVLVHTLMAALTKGRYYLLDKPAPTDRSDRTLEDAGEAL